MTSGDSVPRDHPADGAESLRVVSVIPLVSAWRIDKTFDYLVPEELASEVALGSLVRIPFGHRRIRGIVVGDGDGDVDGDAAPSGELEQILSAPLRHPIAPPPMDELLRWLADRYVVPRAAAFAKVVPPRVRVREADVSERPAAPEARRILRYSGGRDLMEALARGKAGAWSVRVLPGEDRGALIAELVGAAVGPGNGSALVAVPEVRYGNAVLDRLEAVFPSLARVDTAQGDAARARGWMALAAGAAVGGGGRASVLAPAPALRAIVLDEEHHGTFKEDRTPRYDARRVALERARKQGAICIFLSATPTMETSLAVRQGRFGAALPTRELSRAARPIVNTHPQSNEALSPELHHAIRDALRAGQRVGLLVPRRGYASAIWCATCKRSLRCPRCEAGLVFDQGRRSVRCPRCGLTATAPDVCPNCGAHDFRLLGAGSERLQEQLGKAFPRARVARMDPDVLSEDDPEAARVMECDIYVTTWIGTKEALRPPVDLVGVLDVDMLIRRPDFRAAETAYQALAEMSEWAGPASSGGRLVLQCSDPGHHAVQAIVRADHDYFVERELETRSELGYPPFAELLKVTATGPAMDESLSAASELARSMGARVLGPISVKDRGASDERRQILVKADDAGAVALKLRDILIGAPRGTRVSVDVDPR